VPLRDISRRDLSIYIIIEGRFEQLKNANTRGKICHKHLSRLDASVMAHPLFEKCGNGECSAITPPQWRGIGIGAWLRNITGVDSLRGEICKVPSS
jgi:hypothetical protein